MAELYDVLTSYVSLIIQTLEITLEYIFYFPILDSNLGSIVIVAFIVIFFIKLISGWITHKKEGGS